MAERSTNSLSELLQKFASQLGQYRLQAPDPEVPLIDGLLDVFTQIARAPLDQIAAQGLTNAPPSVVGAGPGGPGMGGGGGPVPLGPATAPMPPGAGVPGVRSMPMPTNADELRRMTSMAG